VGCNICISDCKIINNMSLFMNYSQSGNLTFTC
jgi:hypothetical protein